MLRDIRLGMKGAGLQVESAKGECNPGQHEIAFKYTDALTTCDNHVIYKNGAKEIAFAKGVSLTFMAKYDMVQAGSSFHLHSSLWDAAGKKNVFQDKAKPHGSALFGHWVAGQMALAREFSFFYAPYINSYKRYQAGTFAPTRIAWAPSTSRRRRRPTPSRGSPAASTSSSTRSRRRTTTTRTSASCAASA